MLALLTQGCASTPSTRRPAYVSAASAAVVLDTIQRTEITLVCGRPAAPPDGQCVTIDLHRNIQALILQAATLDQQAVAIIRATPEGAPLELRRLVLEIDVLVERILAALPRSPQADLLRAQLAGR